MNTFKQLVLMRNWYYFLLNKYVTIKTDIILKINPLRHCDN